MPPLPPLDSSLYPRTYKIGAGWTFFLLLFGLGLLAGGGFMVWKYFDDPGAKAAMAFAILGPLALAAAFYVFGDTLLSKVVVTADAIELHDLFPVRRMERADIKGRKLIQAGEYGNTLVLIPLDAEKKKLKFPMIVKRDDALNLWIETLPDLDAAEKEASVREIMQDLGDSATPEERLASLAAAKKKAKSLNVTTGIACVAGWFVPGYVPITALLIILPWWALIVAAMSPGLYSLNDHKNDARAGIGLPLIMPGFILLLGTIINYHLLDWTPAHAAAGAIALLVAFLATRVDSQLIKKKTVFLVLPLMIPYGYGSLIMANAVADHSAAKKYETRVISAHYTSGKGAHAELEIEAWGGQPRGNVAVPSSLYRAVKPGDHVCVFLHEGALGMPWYYLDVCHL